MPEKGLRPDLGALLAEEDHAGLAAVARERPMRLLGFVSARLCSADEDEKWRAVRAIGEIGADPELVPDAKARELMRRFVWALNDESGAVPFGIPEAMGELLRVRPELQADFLSILCSTLIHEEMSQTGAIERGALWAVGRVGPAALACAPELEKVVAHTADQHSDGETRAQASLTLALLRGEAVADKK